jgi:hypothetical protein
MKKTLLLMITAFLSISAMGQPVNEKTQIGVNHKQQNFENFQGSLSKGEKLDSTITDTWTQPSGPWLFSSRTKYSYTVVGPLTTQIASKRDASTSWNWLNTNKTETTVDANGKTTLEISYTWSGGAWVGSFRMEFTFDGSGNMTSNSTYMWNIGTSQWDGIAKTVWTYTGSILTLSTGYDWSGGAWVTADKTEYTYSGGVLSQDITSNWTGGAWVTAEKTDYTFTGGKLTLVITSNWTGGVWVNFSKSEYTFDVNGNQTLSISYTWSGSAWVNSIKTESTYASGKITMTSIYNWSVSVWVGLLKNDYTYGVSNGLNYTVTEGSGWVINQWAKMSRSTSWYSGGTTSINKFSEKNIRVYPNPAREFIVFDLTDISESAIAEIFDILGKKVLEQRLSENKQISVSNLPKGLYIYKLKNSGIIYTGKILKE